MRAKLRTWDDIGALNGEEDFYEFLKEVISKTRSLPHRPNLKGDTAFHCLLREQRFKIIEFLLSNGAEPLQPDYNGDTALHHLGTKLHMNKNVKILFKQFLDLGVDVNSHNKQGFTPLLNFID